MEITRIADLRPRFVWDIVDDAFDMYRERFSSFLTLTAVVFVPLRLIQFVLTETYAKPTAKAEDTFTGLFATLGITIPIAMITSFLVYCATVSSVQTQLEGRPADPAATVYRNVFNRAGSVIGATIYIGVGETFGILTCGLLTLYLAVSTIFVAPAILIEKRKLRSALKRSYQLSTSDQGRVLGVLFLTGLINFLLVFGVIGLISGLLAIVPHPASNPFDAAALQRILTEIVSTLAEMLLAPISAIAITLLYFDLRVRREGIDLVAAAEETGVTLADDPFGDLPSDSVLRNQRRDRRK